jgi:hypothetical protein
VKVWRGDGRPDGLGLILLERENTRMDLQAEEEKTVSLLALVDVVKILRSFWSQNREEAVAGWAGLKKKRRRGGRWKEPKK